MFLQGEFILVLSTRGRPVCWGHSPSFRRWAGRVCTSDGFLHQGCTYPHYSSGRKENTLHIPLACLYPENWLLPNAIIFQKRLQKFRLFSLPTLYTAFMPFNIMWFSHTRLKPAFVLSILNNLVSSANYPSFSRLTSEHAAQHRFHAGLHQQSLSTERANCLSLLQPYVCPHRRPFPFYHMASYFHGGS